MRKSKLQSLKSENLKMREFEAMKLNRLDSLYDCLLSKYEKLKIKRTKTETDQKLNDTENTRFKLAAQNLMKIIADLTGCRVDGSTEENDRLNVDAFCAEVIIVIIILLFIEISPTLD